MAKGKIKVSEAKIEQLIPDDKNLNKHTEYGSSLLEKSISQFGLGRSILIDKNNRIIAGNGITETAGANGLEDVLIIETTGDKLVAVKRIDIDLDSKEGRELALADNATSVANLSWDESNMEKVLSDWGIQPKAWGVPEFENIDPNNFGDSFSLPDGEKSQFQQMTFTLSNKQVEEVKKSLEYIKDKYSFEVKESEGNTNSNGNALYILLKQWEELKK